MVSLAVSFLDMPAVFFLMADLGYTLDAEGYASDATAIRHMAGVYYVLALALASLLVERTRLWIAVAIAILCTGALIAMDDGDPTRLAMAVLLIGFMGMLTQYGNSRLLTTMRAVTDEQMRRAQLGRYFSPQIAERLEGGDASLTAGESREVTVLFYDVRDFTALSEALAPDEVVAMLNELHTRLVACLFRYGATLDKFMGDGVMAYFGAPVDDPDHAAQAVRCALDLQRECAALNEDRRAAGKDPLRLGVGLHSGPVVLGDVGSPERRDYTCIGDTVNVAARLEQLTKDRGVAVLVSQRTRQAAGDAAAFEDAGEAEVRGRSGRVRCYVPAGVAPGQPTDSADAPGPAER